MVFVASARFERGAGDSVGDILYLPMYSFIFQEIMSTKQKKKSTLLPNIRVVRIFDFSVNLVLGLGTVSPAVNKWHRRVIFVRLYQEFNQDVQFFLMLVTQEGRVSK